MKIVRPSIQLLTPIHNGYDLLRQIELAARTCYKSEDRITDNSAEKMVATLINSGHEAMLEHASISIKVITNRAVSHEIVRHRLFSFAQESQRYVNYSKDSKGGEITFIDPGFWGEDDERYKMWRSTCIQAEYVYMELLRLGSKPEEAREVLPNSTKTEIVITGNIREWRHFLKFRCAKEAAPGMRKVALMILDMFSGLIPIAFDDIRSGYEEDIKKNAY